MATEYKLSYTAVEIDEKLKDIDNKLNIDDIPTALKNPNLLIIDGKSYDGSVAVDMTDKINALIDAKIENITNAEEVAF